MTALTAHDRLLRRHTLRAAVVAETALHVGTGEAGATGATEMPVARDGRGRPYIPGSSFRGALRSGLESLLRGLERTEVRACDPFDKSLDSALVSCAQTVQEKRKEWRDRQEEITEAESFDLAAGASCAICRLFGHLFLASRVRVADLSLASAGEAPTYVRDGVGLDRDLRTAARNILYSFEAVAAGAHFELRLSIENAEDHELGLLLIGLDLFSEGFARLGGKGARGLGMVKIEQPAVHCRTAEDFFRGADGASVPPDALAGLREAARAHYLGGDV